MLTNFPSDEQEFPHSQMQAEAQKTSQMMNYIYDGPEMIINIISGKNVSLFRSYLILLGWTESKKVSYIGYKILGMSLHYNLISHNQHQHSIQARIESETKILLLMDGLHSHLNQSVGRQWLKFNSDSILFPWASMVTGLPRQITLSVYFHFHIIDDNLTEKLIVISQMIYHNVFKMSNTDLNYFTFQGPKT